MTTAYFLTGSYKYIDNDFELHISTVSGIKENKTESKDHFTLTLTDISSEGKVLWHTSQPLFLLCLDDLDDFLTQNYITLYSKILTSPLRDTAVDKELEGFILNRLDY